MTTRLVSVASNYFGQWSCPSSEKESEEWMCLGTPHSHILSTCTTNVWVELTRPDGLPLHAYFYSQRSTAKKYVLATQALSRPSIRPYSHFLVHCKIEENPLSHLISVQERSDYAFSRWLDHNQLQGRRLVEQNLPLCQRSSERL